MIRFILGIINLVVSLIKALVILPFAIIFFVWLALSERK